MATIYVRSTTGNNGFNGLTWGTAKANMSGGFAAWALGIIYVSSSHSESQGSNQTWTMGVTLGEFARIFCVDDSNQPPTSLATASFTTTGTAYLHISGHGYINGFNFSVGSGTSQANLSLNHGDIDSAEEVFEDCSFALETTGGGSQIAVNTGSGCKTIWNNCTVQFNDVNQEIQVNGGIFHWRGGSILSSGSPTISPSALLRFSGHGVVLIEDVDFSNLDPSSQLTGLATRFQATFRNCKLPTGWTGLLTDSNILAPSRVELWNCDDGNTNYQMLIRDAAGTVQIETTHVRSGGATADGVPISWKMTSDLEGTRSWMSTLYSPEIYVKFDSADVGNSKIVTVEVLWDTGVTMTDNYVRFEGDYFADSSTPIATYINTGPADFLPATAATNIPTSTQSWNTTGMSSPNTYKLSLTFIPQQSGFMAFRVKAATYIATDLYVCPKLTVS